MRISGRRMEVDVIAAELARSQAEFEQAVGGVDDPRRETLRRLLALDFRFFIPGYVFVFATSSILLGYRDFAAAIWLAFLAGVCACLTAFFDVAENLGALRALRGPQGGRSADDLVSTMRSASLRKWSFAFVTTGVLSAPFLQRGSWWYAIGALYIVAALAGMRAVLLNLGRQPVSAVVRNAFRAMGIVALGGLGFAIALAFV